MNVFDMESYLGKSRFNGMLYDIAWRKSSSALSLFVEKAQNKEMFIPELLEDGRSWLNLTIEVNERCTLMFSLTLADEGYILVLGEVGKLFKYFDFYSSNRMDDVQHYVVQYLRNKLNDEDFEKHVKLS